MPIPYPFADGLYASGQPSPGDLALLAAAGVRTVINLRSPAESIGFDEAREVERLGMRYVAFPIGGAQDVTPGTTARFSVELERAQHDGATLIHCASSNRVGALVALERGLIRGESRDEAICVGRAAGLTTLESHVAEMLEHHSHH